MQLYDLEARVSLEGWCHSQLCDNMNIVNEEMLFSVFNKL